MSGIFGIVRRDGQSLDTRDLECMRASLAHRGPDGSNIWVEGSVGMGQLMLHSTPESLDEKLPWKDPETGLVITADARIDNREELITKLGPELKPALRAFLRQCPHRQQNGFQQLPDSQLILAAFKRWGDASVDHLLGDFVFVIWDGRNKRLFCARDHMGIRPFYFHLSENVFVFASSALAVVSVESVPKRVNEEQLADYLARELAGFDKVSSWFEGVRRMPPAHIAALSANGLTTRNYWQLDPETELKLSSDEEYIDALDEALTTAVKARMRSHQPVAYMLSGGLDSSIIVGTARKLQQGSNCPLPVFSGVSENVFECGEARFSQLVINQGGLDSQFLRPSDVARFDNRLRQVDHVLEDPFDAMWIMHKMIYLSAVERGSVAVMDGIDGDGVASLTTTYPAYLVRAGQWGALHQDLLQMQKDFSNGEHSLWKYYAHVLRPVLVPDVARKIKRSLSRPKEAWMSEDCLASLAFAARVGLQKRFQQYRKTADFSNCGTLRKANVARVNVAYLTAGIERYGRLAAICRAEQRQPLLDKRFVEFCVALPWQFKIKGGWSKYGLRRVAERTLPAEVAWRPVRNHVMSKFWAEWDNLNRDRNKEVLSGKPAIMENIIDQKKFMACKKQYMIGEDESKEGILSLICLFKWLERHQ